MRTEEPLKGLCGSALKAALLLGLFLLPHGAAAQTLCTEPVSPTCVERDSTYEAVETQKRCRQQVEGYAKEMKAFEACLGDSAERARESRTSLARRFACRLEGRTRCDVPPGRESGQLPVDAEGG
jgi:hypothetical protein